MIDKIIEKQPGLKSTKTRAIITFTVIVIVAGIVVGYLMLSKRPQQESIQQQGLSTVPAIRSVPGEGTPPRQYIKLQEEQNVQLAQEALKKGGSAIPTLTRVTYLGEGGLLTPGAGEKTPGCSPEELQRAREAGVSAFELHCRGCSADALKAAGYTAGELRNAGFTADQLAAAGFTPDELKQAGFPTALPEDAKKVDCSADTLRQAHDKGVSAAEFISCGAAALKAAGYTARELKDAGFSAGELRDAGFTPEELKAAGFDAKELRNAGFSPEQLKAAGYGLDQLRAAGFTNGDLVRGGFSPDAVTPPKVVAIQPATSATSTTTAPTAETLALPSGTSQLAGLPMTPEQSLQERLAKIQAAQAAQMSLEQQQEQERQLEQNMQNQAGELFSSWVPLPKQQFINAPEQQLQPGGAGQQAGTAAGDQQALAGDVYKAGSVLFAVLDTGINSDEKSPIMATIVSGPLKGAKLLGNFNREDKTVVVQFTLVSIPYMDKSVPINAYGIDPNTAHAALATSVDNHYMLRYGTLFASAFAEGLGQAIQSSGQTTVISDLTVKQVWANLNTQDKALVALGQVGTRFGDAMKDYFNTPPTVRVAAGSGLGILLMADLTVPKKK